ncbi:MAG: sulfatase [Bacteroidales bacterium]
MLRMYNNFFFTLGGIAALVICNGCAKKDEKKPLNIVYIMTDDHTRQAMGCYGSRYADTPNLDRIAEEGVLFTNSYVANSLSGPSRACILTGKHSHINGFTDNTKSFDGSQQTFPKLLQKAGYQTAIIGKWHLHTIPTGFDYWDVLIGQGDYYNPDFITMGDTIKNEGYVTNIITDKSIEWLENRRNKEKPFCLMIHHKAAHRNWMADTCNLNDYEETVFPLPVNFYDDYSERKASALQEMDIRTDDMDLLYDLKMYRPGDESRLRRNYISDDGKSGYYGGMNDAQKKVWDAHYNPIIEKFFASSLKGNELIEWKYQRYMRDYMKTVKSLDNNIGRLLDYLEKNGLLENTLIVYTSDQGFYMGEHGWFDKRFMYDESFSTPLIMRLPKTFERRGKVTELVQNIDYAPTLLDIAGAEIPTDIQGTSLMPLLKGERPQNWRKALYYHYYEYPAEHAVRKHYGIYDGRYKLIHFYGNDIDEWELFDLKNDPHEMYNIYSHTKERDIIKHLKTELKKLQIQYKDTILNRFPL